MLRFGMLRASAGEADARKLRLYAGAMQYHAWWDMLKMESHGWHFSLRAAANM
jgi:hypothetical protein